MFQKFGIDQRLLDPAGVERIDDAEARRRHHKRDRRSNLNGLFLPYLIRRPAIQEQVGSVETVLNSTSPET